VRITTQAFLSPIDILARLWVCRHYMSRLDNCLGAD
jgi:hypothetical protein